MGASDLLAFVVASLVMVALPGRDQALITRNAPVGGPAAGWRTMLGGACGLSVHATAAAVGLAAAGNATDTPDQRERASSPGSISPGSAC